MCVQFKLALFKNKKFVLFPAALQAAQSADIQVFHPAGATRCTDGVKFGTEVWTFGSLLRVKFIPIGAPIRV